MWGRFHLEKVAQGFRPWARGRENYWGDWGSRRRQDQCCELGMVGLGRKWESKGVLSTKAVSKDNTFE